MQHVQNPKGPIRPAGHRQASLKRLFRGTSTIAAISVGSLAGCLTLLHMMGGMLDVSSAGSMLGGRDRLAMLAVPEQPVPADDWKTRVRALSALVPQASITVGEAVTVGPVVTHTAIVEAKAALPKLASAPVAPAPAPAVPLPPQPPVTQEAMAAAQISKPVSMPAPVALPLAHAEAAVSKPPVPAHKEPAVLAAARPVPLPKPVPLPMAQAAPQVARAEGTHHDRHAERDKPKVLKPRTRLALLRRSPPAAKPAPVDHRSFFERMFGQPKTPRAALAYAPNHFNTMSLGHSASTQVSASAGTAVYNIAEHTVVLPNGERLEAHSGLGNMIDDPRFVNQRMRGPTPPHLYDLTYRRGMFHGVQALRLTPVGGGSIYGRTGLLAHSFMLGRRGDSNGCVSFRNYQAFLQAFRSGLVKRLLVVAGR